MTRILITGSNSGFGNLAALTFARQGHEVIATMRTVAKGDELRSTAEAELMSLKVTSSPSGSKTKSSRSIASGAPSARRRGVSGGGATS